MIFIILKYLSSSSYKCKVLCSYTLYHSIYHDILFRVHDKYGHSFPSQDHLARQSSSCWNQNYFHRTIGTLFRSIQVRSKRKDLCQEIYSKIPLPYRSGLMPNVHHCQRIPSLLISNPLIQKKICSSYYHIQSIQFHNLNICFTS